MAPPYAQCMLHLMVLFLHYGSYIQKPVSLTTFFYFSLYYYCPVFGCVTIDGEKHNLTVIDAEEEIIFKFNTIMNHGD
jgi:hypothetical protein